MIAPDNAYCEMRARSLGVALGVLLKYDLADNAQTQFWPGESFSRLRFTTFVRISVHCQFSMGINPMAKGDVWFLSTDFI